MKRLILLSSLALAGCNQCNPNDLKWEIGHHQFSGVASPIGKPRDYCSFTIDQKPWNNHASLYIQCLNAVTGKETYAISSTLVIWDRKD